MVIVLVAWVVLSIVVGLAVGAAIDRGDRMALRIGPAPSPDEQTRPLPGVRLVRTAGEVAVAAGPAGADPGYIAA